MSEHERSDVNVKRIALAGVGIAVFVLSVLGASLLLYRGFGMRQEPGASSLADAGAKYDGPLLQLRPEEELAEMRKADADKLSEYAWENKPGGAVRIPINEAMKLLVQRGLPPVTSPPVSFEDLQRQPNP